MSCCNFCESPGEKVEGDFIINLNALHCNPDNLQSRGPVCINEAVHIPASISMNEHIPIDGL